METKEINVTSPATNFCPSTSTNPTQNPPALLENYYSNPSSTSSSSKLVLSYPDINAYLESFPKGYRFKPTEEELIVHYLLKKLENGKLPPSRIHDVDIYKESPFYLSANYDEANEDEWYFFSPREKKYPNGNRPNRAAGNGYWKATGADKSIKSSKNIKVEVGLVKTLVYYEGIPTNSRKTSWIMKEYKVKGSPLSNSSKEPMKLDDYILYKIYEKKSSKATATNVEDGEAANDQDHGRDEDFHVADQPQNIHQNHRPDEVFHVADQPQNIHQNHRPDEVFHLADQPQNIHQDHPNNIREIDNSGGQQQQLMWRIPIVNELYMLIPEMLSNGFNNQNHDSMLHGNLDNNQPIVSNNDMGYIDYNAQDFSQAIPPADAFNDKALPNESIIPQQISPAIVPDAFNNVHHQAFNNGMNIPQMQQRQNQHRPLVMTRPLPSSSNYHPYHHPDLPHN